MYVHKEMCTKILILQTSSGEKLGKKLKINTLKNIYLYEKKKEKLKRKIILNYIKPVT